MHESNTEGKQRNPFAPGGDGIFPKPIIIRSREKEVIDEGKVWDLTTTSQQIEFINYGHNIAGIMPAANQSDAESAKLMRRICLIRTIEGNNPYL